MKWRAEDILFALLGIGGLVAMIVAGMYGLWTGVDIPIWGKTMISGGVFFFVSVTFCGL